MSHAKFKSLFSIQTRKGYRWKEPKICTEKGGVELPEFKDEVDCPTCNPGLFNNGSNCEFCPSGTFSDGKTGERKQWFMFPEAYCLLDFSPQDLVPSTDNPMPFGLKTMGNIYYLILI